jgi:predicted transcriptional regulator
LLKKFHVLTAPETLSFLEQRDARGRMDRRTQGFSNMRYADKKEAEDKVLKTVYHLSLEDPDRSTYLTNVQHATGLGQKEIQDICKILIKRGHIERTNFRLTITDEGVHYAEKYFV